MNNQPYFLQKVAHRVLESMKEETKVAIILPNRRPAIYIKKYISEQIKSPIFLPDILTIEEFFFKITGLLKADYTQQLILLNEAYKKANIGTDTIEDILNWAPTFISDCNDIDNALVEPAHFFNVLLEEKELRNWNLGEDLTSMQEEYLKFWRQAPELYQAFTDILLEKKATYSGLSYRIGIEKLEQNWELLPYDKLMFVGFNALNNAEERLIDLALEHNAGEVIWDMDGYYLNDEMLKAGHYFRKYMTKWKFDNNVPTITGYRNESINIIKSPNTAGQTDAVYSLIQKQCQGKSQEQLKQTAIILCDETLLEPLLLRLPEEYTYNITMGKPLKSFGQFHLFDSLINLYHDKRSSGYTSDSIMNLINSPYIDILDFADTGKKLQQQIIANNQYYIEPKDITPFCENEKDTWYEILNCKATPLDILDLSLEIIRRLRAYYLENKDRGNIEVLYEFRNLLVTLINIGKTYPDILTMKTMSKLFHKVVAQAKIPYEGEPVEGIQIMGLLESRTLDFEHIILVSANETILPESKNSQSFIPYIFKKHFGMPTYNERDAIFAYSFYRLLHQAKKMDILYSGGKDLGGELSRYVEQIRSEYNEKAAKPTKIRSFGSIFPTTEIDLLEYKIEKTPEILDSIKVFIKEKTFSPSSLNTLLKSPLDFYFRKIARVKEPDLLESNMEANTFGTVLHNTLEEIYKPYIGQVLDTFILNDIESNIVTELDKQFAQEFKGGDLTRGQNYLLRQAGEMMVKEVVNIDRKRIQKHTITVLRLEDGIHSEMDLVVDGQPMKIKLYGQVDRIQSVDDKVEIIDYKSGFVDKLQEYKIEKAGTDENNEKMLQLLAYSWMTTHRTDSHESYEVSQIRPALQALKSWQKGLTYIESEDYEITNEHFDKFKENLSKQFTILLDEKIPLTPEIEDKRIRFSPYKRVWL